MTIRQIINVMKQVGYDVSFYVRKDGGIRITKINGQRFTGSKGNVRAREITGEQLSEARSKQLKKIAPTESMKGKGRYNKRRKRKLDADVEKEIARLQRKYRKKKTQGQPTKRNYRWVLEHYGKKEADRLLKQADLYIRGLAYSENIDALIARLQSDKDKVDSPSDEMLVDKIIKKLESMKGTLKESTLSEILDDKGALYRWEKGEITAQEMYRDIMNKLNKN